MSSKREAISAGGLFRASYTPPPPRAREPETMHESKTNTDLLLALIVAVLIYMMFCRSKSAMGRKQPAAAASPAVVPDPVFGPVDAPPPTVSM